MRCFQVLSLIVGFAFVSNALPQAPARRHVASKQAVSPTNSVLLKDFILSSFVATSTSHAVHHQYNRSMSFVFSDPNSNTSTVCASKWTDGADSNSTTAHLGPSYLVCDTTNGTAKPEAFDWYFASYIDYSHFSLELAHSFSDPANYPPPYDYVEYFATANVTLGCKHSNGAETCTLPTSTSPIHATITSITN